MVAPHRLSDNYGNSIFTADPADNSDARSRPSMRAVAQAAGVSAMTVSRALRNHPAVSPDLRAQVQRAARALGYRPDPTIAKLMHHLRVRRKPSFQGSLCAITTLLAHRPYSSYAEGVLCGAQRQAEARGYGFSTLHVETTQGAARSLQRTLRNRGVEGVLLLPMAVPTALPHLLDWREFSVVATTSSVTEPDVHRVVPHHFKNTQLLCQSLRALGYRRIGLVQSREHVDRVYHSFNAAVAWDGIFHDNQLVTPFIYSGAMPTKLGAWFEREKPDVIIAHSDALCLSFAEMLGLKIPGPVGFATTSTTPASGCAGINELTAEIGAASVDLLTGLIQRGEKGVPDVPTATQLIGRWVQGRSCPRRRGAAAATAASKRPRLIYFEE